jgi:hypothetical protein
MSPLTRPVHALLLHVVADIVWAFLSSRQLRFEVWEGVRERIGHHPCDKRRNVAELKSKFPQFSFNRVQDEEDRLWSDAREPTEDLLQRARTFLDALRQRSGEPSFPPSWSIDFYYNYYPMLLTDPKTTHARRELHWCGIAQRFLDGRFRGAHRGRPQKPRWPTGHPCCLVAGRLYRPD